MFYWWEASTDERYWCEITDRDDIGADLHCPQTDESGKSYWSYSLVNAIWAGRYRPPLLHPIESFRRRLGRRGTR
jgi:hypothetical protein